MICMIEFLNRFSRSLSHLDSAMQKVEGKINFHVLASVTRTNTDRYKKTNFSD